MLLIHGYSLSLHASISTTNKKPRAVVIGGSLAGMLTARTLSEHYQVTVLEKDSQVALSTKEDVLQRMKSRSSIPQGKHIHVLLAEGARILEELFPTIQSELVRRGGEVVDWPKVYSSCIDGRWFARDPNSSVDYGIPTVICSRPLIEQTVREYVQRINDIEFMSGARVTELVASEDRGRISGIVARVVDHNVNASVGFDHHIKADLVIDAMGRGTLAEKWLSELGYALPSTDIIDANIAYADRILKPPTELLDRVNFKVLRVENERGHGTRSGIIFSIEDGYWLCGLAGYMGDHPPRQSEAWFNFAKTLPHSSLYELITQCEPVTGVSIIKSTKNIKRSFKNIPEDNYPSGFLCIGDSMCAPNPVYGQGMTMSALGAVALGKFIGEQKKKKMGIWDRLFNVHGSDDRRSHNVIFDARTTKRAQMDLEKSVETAWTLATSNDKKYITSSDAEENKKQSFVAQLLAGYFDRLLVLCFKEAALNAELVKVGSLMKPFQMLFAPKVLWAVFKSLLFDGDGDGNGEGISNSKGESVYGKSDVLFKEVV